MATGRRSGPRRPGPHGRDTRARTARRITVTLIGYTMMCEQAGPKQLVHDVALAEQAGFDFAVISDHYFPWRSTARDPFAAPVASTDKRNGATPAAGRGVRAGVG